VAFSQSDGVGTGSERIGPEHHEEQLSTIMPELTCSLELSSVCLQRRRIEPAFVIACSATSERRGSAVGIAALNRAGVAFDQIT
jgi:hypothetical protein